MADTAIHLEECRGRTGALRLNVHLHVLCLDGVYVRDAENCALVFEGLGAPTLAEVLDVARRTAERVDGLLRKSGRSLEPSTAASTCTPSSRSTDVIEDSLSARLGPGA